MFRTFARGGLARGGSGGVAKAVASLSSSPPASSSRQIAAAGSATSVPLARIGMHRYSSISSLSIGGERAIELA